MDLQTLEFTKIVASFLIVSIPVFGVTARFVMRPLVDGLVRLREAQNPERGAAERRIALLEDELLSLRGTVRQLSEEVEFYRGLQAAPDLPRVSSGA